VEQPPDRAPHAPADVRPLDSRLERSPLLIRVSTGSGAGPTPLAAFDAALFDAGVAQFNLVRLTSVIPPDAVVREVAGPDQIRGAKGDVAYCVYAAAYASTPGEQTWAGIAWAVHQDRSGVGLFVEQSASSEPALLSDLRLTLEAMSRTRGNQYRIVGQTVGSAVCADRPVCTVVVATYGTARWSDLLTSEG
jgi:arginine decarboxylase